MIKILFSTTHLILTREGTPSMIEWSIQTPCPSLLKLPNQQDPHPMSIISVKHNWSPDHLVTQKLYATLTANISTQSQSEHAPRSQYVWTCQNSGNYLLVPLSYYCNTVTECILEGLLETRPKHAITPAESSFMLPRTRACMPRKPHTRPDRPRFSDGTATKLSLNVLGCHRSKKAQRIIW